MVRKLAGTGWRTTAKVLPTTTLALCCSVAQYCAPVWLNSARTDKIYVYLRAAMRKISGTLKSTNKDWLFVLEHIASPRIRWEYAFRKFWDNFSVSHNCPMYKYKE